MPDLDATAYATPFGCRADMLDTSLLPIQSIDLAMNLAVFYLQRVGCANACPCTLPSLKVAA